MASRNYQGPPGAPSRGPLRPGLLGLKRMPRPLWVGPVRALDILRPPKVPPLRALWSLLVGIWGILKCSWGVLDNSVAELWYVAYFNFKNGEDGSHERLREH